MGPTRAGRSRRSPSPLLALFNSTLSHFASIASSYMIVVDALTAALVLTLIFKNRVAVYYVVVAPNRSGENSTTSNTPTRRKPDFKCSTRQTWRSYRVQRDVSRCVRKLPRPARLSSIYCHRRITTFQLCLVKARGKRPTQTIQHRVYRPECWVCRKHRDV